MKTKFKSLISLFLVLALVFSLAACGNGGTESVVDLGADEEWDVNADNGGNGEQGTDGNASGQNGAQNTPGNTQNTPGSTQNTPGNTQNTPGSTQNTPGNTQTPGNNQNSNGNNQNQGNTQNGNQGNTGNNQNNQGNNQNNTQGNPSVQGPASKNGDDLSWNQLLAQMPQSLRGTTLKVYSWNPIKDVTGAEKVISDFEKQTGIKVDWKVGNYDTYDSDIAARINSGDSPDIIRYNNPSPSKMYSTQDVLTATGFDFKGAIWDERVTSSYSVNGKIYGVNLKNTFNQQPTVVTYSMSTINRYKLEDPYTLWKQGKWTWNKFVEMCKDFKEETGRPAWMTSGHFEPLWFNNVNMITFDGKKYKNNLSDPAVLKALQQSANNLADGITCEAMREHDKLENGTYLFFTTNILAARRTDFHFSTLKTNDDLYCVPVPTGMSSDGKYYTHFQEFEAYGIPKGAKNASAVYYFLRYYLNADNYDEDMFFVNNQTLETYKYCMNQKNYHYTIDGSLTGDVGTANGDLDKFIRTGGSAAQVKNKLDEVSNIFERAAKYGNELIAKF